MSNRYNELLGEGPYPFPLDKLEDFTEYFEGSDLAIIFTRTDMTLNSNLGEHRHDSFEFLIPFVPMSFVGCEGVNHFVRGNSVFPINSNQEHGPLGEMKKCCFAAIQAGSSLVKKVLQNVVGDSNFKFKNEEFSVSTELKDLISKFVDELKSPKAGHVLMVDILSTQIVVQLVRDYEARESNEYDAEITGRKSNLDSAVRFINENKCNSEYSTRKAARIANLSGYHFIRTFRNETGKTPYNFLLDLKINKAKELLKEKNQSITEICFSCGFINHSHFATAFKKRVGMTPSMYRKIYSIR
jgi:Transcriptional regulator containing an amidase domain and an AraC-type DNA-binding HTH domain